MTEKIPRLVLAGTASGCGKTTVTCAVLDAMRGQGVRLRSFKCGPDYIDPMFHTKVLGIPCRNLDTYLCSEETVRHLFARGRKFGDDEVSIIEGVMGYYDGEGGESLHASTHHIASVLGAPVVLVMSGKGRSLSLAAELQGFLHFAKNNIAGVIFNDISEHSYPMYRRIVEEHTGARVLGYLPNIPDAMLPRRHLGLVTAGELCDLRERVDKLSEAAARTIDLAALIEIAHTAPALSYEPVSFKRCSSTVRVGVARDTAFCFYYDDNLRLLKEMGAVIEEFSPAYDQSLPRGLSGLYLGGGYPELHLNAFTKNRAMLSEIAQAVSQGMPTIAECGGFMLLCDEIEDGVGVYPMSGAIRGRVKMRGKLSRFGYATMTAKRDNLLCRQGEVIPIHEFHYSDADDPGDAFTAQKRSGATWDCIHASDSLFAGYPHVHFWSNPQYARNFVERCISYRSEQQ